MEGAEEIGLPNALLTLSLATHIQYIALGSQFRLVLNT